MASDTFNETTNRFQSWFAALPGSTFHPAIQIQDLRSQHAGRGIVATADIPADTVLFTVPRTGILSVTTSDLGSRAAGIFDDPLPQPPTQSSHDAMDEDAMDGDGDGDGDDNDDSSQNDDQAHDSWSRLILVLMYEHLRPASSASPWRAYLDMLPASFDTPMFWTDAELAELQASPLVGRIGRADAEAMFRRKVIPAIRQYQHVFFADGGADSVLTDQQLVERAHRMGSTIMAYAFDLEADEDDEDEQEGWVEDKEGRGILGMVPMADVLNADAEFNAHVNHEDHCLTVTSLRPIRAGEEILNYYGPRPNSEVLRQYGYVTEKQARYDVVEIPWSVAESALKAVLKPTPKLWKSAMNLINVNDLQDSFVLERDSPDVQDDGTFSGPAKLGEMPPDLTDQLKDVLRALAKVDARQTPDKRKRNDTIGAVLAKCVESLVRRYATTLVHDQRLLANAHQLPPRQRMALQVRYGEKLLLREASELLARTSTAGRHGQATSPPAKDLRTRQ